MDQPDLEKEKCFISTKLWSFYLPLWEGMELLKGSWCWGGSRRSQWWFRTCSFPLFFPPFSNSSWNLFLSPFLRIQNVLIPDYSIIQVFLKSVSSHSTAPWLLFRPCGAEKVWDGEGPDGGRMPQQSCWAQLPTWIAGANAHLCRYKWSHPHVSKAGRLMTLEIWCPRLRDVLITALHFITA